MASSSIPLTPNSNPEVLARARKQLEKSNYHVINGVVYWNFFHKDIYRGLKNAEEEELHKDDVINVGIPRSGNHWMLELVEMVLRNEATYGNEPFVHRFLENWYDYAKVENENKLKRSGQASPDPRVIITHLRVSRGPRQIHEKNTRVVYILRNPKDAIFSWYKLLSQHRAESQRFHGSWEEFFELALTGEVPFGTWFDHVLDFEKFTHDHPSVPVFIAQFEKMKSQPEEEIRKLARFLNRPEDKVAEIAKAVEFDAMKAGTAEKIEAINKVFLMESSQGIVVKGSVCGWKKHFTVDMSERFNREFEERMKGSKIADMVRKYI